MVEKTEQTQLDGLSTAEVAERRSRFGPNALPVPGHRLLRLILRQFRGVFNIMLFVAAAVTFALGSPIDGSFILLFVFLGAGLNVFQEYKSNQAADKLKAYLLSTITVRRDGGDQEVSTAELVPGDILKLESGDIVPADAIVRVARDLLVDETTFTGESIPVAKSATTAASEESDEEHHLLQGVVIVRGNTLAEVTAIGINTKLAQIAATASSVQAESKLVKNVDRISNFVMKATLLTLAFVILANILIDGWNTDIPGLLIFSIALAVSAIPEALPLVLTFSLSRGALEFAKRDVIVKRLSSVQDLGSVNLLCTDKTGTITENHLIYVNEYPMATARFDPIILARLAAINLHDRIPEPFDHAVDEALSPEQRAAVDAFQLLEEEAFDPALRSNGAVVSGPDGVRLHIRRGGPEYFFEQGLIERSQVSNWIDEEERQGHRVLGVSYDDGSGARFGGFVSFVDRIKETTAETVALARKMNVEITIITGDALLVADAVGREAGLVTGSNEVMDATAFLTLPKQEQRKRTGIIRVFARTTPEQKLELIQLLKEQYTVGFLGEGINDAPALKAANVSMVVQSASDVARETADIVLLKNDLRVIVEGIRFGRETFANTLKYIRATLISNFGNFYAVAIGSLFISFLPMLPKQLLLLNLLSDFPMMAIAFDRVTDEEVARPQTYDLRSLYIVFVTMGLVSTVFDFICFGLFYRISPEVLQTNWFIASVITEILLMLSIRSMLPITKAGWPAPSIVVLSVIAVVLALTLPILPWSAAFFEFKRPTLAHLGLILGIVISYLIVTELVKRPLMRFLNKK